jgi:hypothetical protein
MAASAQAVRAYVTHVVATVTPRQKKRSAVRLGGPGARLRHRLAARGGAFDLSVRYVAGVDVHGDQVLPEAPRATLENAGERALRVWTGAAPEALGRGCEGGVHHCAERGCERRRCGLDGLYETTVPAAGAAVFRVVVAPAPSAADQRRAGRRERRGRKRPPSLVLQPVSSSGRTRGAEVVTVAFEAYAAAAPAPAARATRPGTRVTWGAPESSAAAATPEDLVLPE